MQTQTVSPSPSLRTSLFTLDMLAHKSHAELDSLYRSAQVSTSMRAADGALIGRMLAVKSLPGMLAGPIAKWAASNSFVWEGKSFEAASDTHGMGFNRVNVPNMLGRQNLFPFATSFGASAIDGKPTLILDYDLAVNPGYIRHVHDEIREVSPGLFLGPAMWKRGPEKLMVLWFGLDATRARN
ncbi:MAG TPA: hypothetical protein VGC41_27730 [Kofleriaceae bacterium]